MSFAPTRMSRACRGEKVDSVPVWLMRQAGRYMPEYQAIRQGVDFLAFCQNADLCAQATLDAARILGTDAAIIFSDITVPAVPMGLELVFDPGPVFKNPVRTAEDVSKLKEVDPQRDLPFVLEAIDKTRRGLPDEVSLIGFVGAPLTLAGYMIEGKPTPQWIELKKLLFNEPKTAHALLDRVADMVAAHLEAQVRAGCDIVQLFDTTAGELPAAELRVFAFTYARKVIEKLRPLGVPIIYFARRIGAHLEAAAETGADVLGLDWTVTVSEARRRLNDGVALMGNLDPVMLMSSPENIERRVREILAEAEGLDGFVFNLGHGVLPPTPPANAKHLVQCVHQHGVRS